MKETDNLVLKSTGINKRFGGVHALADMSFELRQGEVHALVGENGAGKSTYIKILSGVYQKDSGTNLFNGREINFHTTIEARRAGIGMVPQIIELAPKLTVAENIFMGVYPAARVRDRQLEGAVRQRARRSPGSSTCRTSSAWRWKSWAPGTSS